MKKRAFGISCSWGYSYRSFFDIQIANDYVYKSTSADSWSHSLWNESAKNRIFKMVSLDSPHKKLSWLPLATSLKIKLKFRFTSLAYFTYCISTKAQQLTTWKFAFGWSKSAGFRSKTEILFRRRSLPTIDAVCLSFFFASFFFIAGVRQKRDPSNLARPPSLSGILVRFTAQLNAAGTSWLNSDSAGIPQYRPPQH